MSVTLLKDVFCVLLPSLILTGFRMFTEGFDSACGIPYSCHYVIFFPLKILVLFTHTMSAGTLFYFSKVCTYVYVGVYMCVSVVRLVPLHHRIRLATYNYTILTMEIRR